MARKQCMFCGEWADISLEDPFTYQFVECPVCGRYKQKIYPEEFGASFKDEAAAYLYYSKHSGKGVSDKSYNFLGSREAFEETKKEYPWAYYASEDEIKAFYPKKFNDRINRILLDISGKSNFIGDTITYKREEILSAFFLKRYGEQGEELSIGETQTQIDQIISYMSENSFFDYIHPFDIQDSEYDITLKPEGWNRIDEIQQSEKSSNTVFVAMSFAEDMKDVREAIKKAILDNGYVPRIMDEIEHNHQIVPEMLYEIRQSKFVIAELTNHNNGAYFEAGYALGQGKEVIQVCKEDRFHTDGHFDVKQINTIMWNSTEDLIQKLSARIKATIN